MLKSLSINNIALINKCEIDFFKGLNILTGETGAGKSIIIDSINFVLGKRADKTLIRYGEAQAKVEAIFSFEKSNTQLTELLEDYEICDNEIFVSRVMTIDGNNICKINGKKVTLSMLKSITELLVDIYGQNEGSKLFDEKTHIDILDRFCGEDLQIALSKYAELFSVLKDINFKLKKYGTNTEINKNIEYLAFQIEEIEKANLEVGEEEILEKQNDKYNNIEEILKALNNTYELLSGDENQFNAVSAINTSCAELNGVKAFDAEIEDCYSRLDSVKIELQDIASVCSGLAESTDYDFEDATRVQERLSLIFTLKKKYGNSIEAILAELAKMQEQYDWYANSEEKLAQMNKQKQEILKQIFAEASKITNIRKNFAKKLSGLVVNELKALNMPSIQFDCSFNKIEELKEENLKNNGVDIVEFLISPNAGEPMRSLSKIISGGEMSRFMLALKNIIANLDGVDVMIFDEVDAGISGNTAQVVAEKLYNISVNKQVLAVTHLPQLTSMADFHYLIEKYEKDNKTFTKLELLDNEKSVLEIARMIGSGDTAVNHAKEMKNHAKIIKSNYTKLNH
ncbi:MAG: DNA repair protein RecN [Clostridia bacterium]